MSEDFFHSSTFDYELLKMDLPDIITDREWPPNPWKGLTYFMFDSILIFYSLTINCNVYYFNGHFLWIKR